MNFHELRYIRCIAKHGNITKAAQELFISQPTLSKYLQKIERELNGKLFSRIDNQYTPTYLGKRYLAYAERMLALHQDWEKELWDITAGKEGELNIAFPLMRSSCMIPVILPVFSKKHPTIRVNFLEETYAIQEKLLLDDQVNFAIFNEAAPHPNLSYEPLGQEEILLVTCASHPLTRERLPLSLSGYPVADFNKLKEDSYILHFPDQTTGKMTRQLLECMVPNPHILFQTRNTQAALEMASQGLGICFAPESYIKQLQFRKPITSFSVKNTPLYSPVTIAYRKGSYLPSYGKDFIEIVKKNFL